MRGCSPSHGRNRRSRTPSASPSTTSPPDSSSLRSIESVSAVDEPLRSQDFGRSWTAIWSVRNRITHGYFSVDRTIITSTVQNDLVEFEASVERLIRTVDQAGAE